MKKLSLPELNAQSFGLRRDVRALEKGGKLVGQDLEILDVNIKALEGRIGDKVKVSGQEVPNLATAIDVIHEMIKSAERTINEMHTSFNLALSDETVRINDLRDNQENNWKRATQLFLQMKDVIRAHLQFPLDKLADRMQFLENKLKGSKDTLSANALQTEKKSNRSGAEDDDEFGAIFEQDSAFHTAKDSSIDKEVDNAALLDRIGKLENKLNEILTQNSSPSIRINDIQFFSSEDVKVWAKSHVTGYRFGLFLDGVSIWEHFTVSYQSMPEVINSFRDTARIGFATLHEGKVATSFQNVLPALLGRGLDTSMFLPGLTSYSKWDNNDINLT